MPKPERWTDHDLAELWRQKMYPHIEKEVFERHFNDEDLAAWDRTRREVKTLIEIVKLDRHCAG